MNDLKRRVDELGGQPPWLAVVVIGVGLVGVAADEVVNVVPLSGAPKLFSACCRGEVVSVTPDPGTAPG
ncbi:hypothetical protein [Nocardia gipuzkoensis]|uniref:hypothetical protein n=1 Tax=Nocardia gipuzkoensis TaxID=2749991 RepID=UPI00237E1048|nr:hypothetical protein [Nocardia gipuzkoensis]MDE1675076.1 hypothetical protein [Nocardia gipuzkoensis]